MRQLDDWEKANKSMGQVNQDLKKSMQPAKREQLSSLPSRECDSSLTTPALIPVVKRGRGRPRKTEAEKVNKASQVLERVAQDVITISDPAFDGGGTEETSPIISKESLERRVARRLNVLDRYLTDDRLLALMGQSGLKEIGVYEGIMMDKALVLKGQPTVIVGSEDRTNMDTILPKLLGELRRRKLITTVSERKIEFQEA